MTHRTPADAYRSIQLLAKSGARCKLLADRYGWHVSIIRNKRDSK